VQTGYRDATYLIRSATTRAVSQAIKVYARSSPSRHVTVLDVGGRGRPYAELFRDRLGEAGRAVRYMVLDPDPGADVLGHAEKLPIASRSIDVLLCTQVLEHVADPQRSVAEMARVLKPEGLCLLTTHGTWFYHPDPQDYSGAGFDQVSVRPVGGTKLALAVLVMTALDRATGPGILGSLIGRLLVAPANFVGSRWLLARNDGRTSVPGELVINYLVTAVPDSARSAPAGG
jgi:SAM-dependent methyltransferase